MSLVMVFFGTHRFARKRVGFRPDVCLSCGAEAMAFEYRSFDVGHFYWLPLLPLGFRRHWRCSACDEDPRGERTRQGMKVLGVIFFVAISIGIWLAPVENDVAFMWAMRIGFPLLVIATIASMRQRKGEDRALRERLRRIPPLGDDCPICGGRVSTGKPRQCRKCGAIEGRAPELAAS